MALEVKLPELGENLEGGEVLDVKVAAGEEVREGQTLMEVEAEKSTVEVPAPAAGRVSKLTVKKGDQIKVGQTICVLDAKEKAAAPTPAQAAPAESPREKPPEQPKAETERTKPAAETPARERPAAERLPDKSAPQRRPDGATAVGNGKRSENAPVRPAAQAEATSEVIPAGPATRRMAREFGVDLSRVSGTGRNGRVTEDDVKTYVRQLATGIAANGFSVQAPPLPDFERWGPVERRPLAAIRRRTAEQMSLAWNLVPHVTQHDQADITDLDQFRRQQEGSGPRLTVTAFALRAAANALKQFPQFNSSLDLAQGQLILKRYYHIGVAVDTEHGLLVPVINDVDRKSVRELAQELADVADRARQRKLSAEEMRGGTFTITNLGGIGGTGFSPIVNYPQVAILGISRARMQPVIRDDQVVPRLVLPVSLSYDHRVIDGADAARFTRRLAEMFENPLLMLL